MAVIAGMALLFAVIAEVARTSTSWWISQALEIALYFYPQLAWMAGAGVLVALIAATVDMRVWRIRSLWLLVPFAVPIAILAYGIIFAFDQAPASVIEQRRGIVEALPWLHVPIGIILLACFRSIANWLIIGGFSTAAVWLSLGSAVLSWMSVTNIWL
jgi:hypothetical protein